MRNKPVLVLAKPDDFHIPFVSKNLAEEPIIVNFGDVTQGFNYAFTRNGTQVTVMYGGQELPVLRDAIASVWNRRTNVRGLLPQGLSIQPLSQEAYALSSMQNLGDSFLELLDPALFWVSDQFAVRRAERKPRQLKLAREVGFNIPDTLFTASAEQAKAFVNKHGACIVKTLSRDMVEGHGQYAVIRASHQLKFEGLGVNPHIFQQALTPKKEVRVAVIGKEVFVSEVENLQADEALASAQVRDYRHAFETNTLKVSPFILDDVIAERCVRLNEASGTVCGFMDLIQDTDGVWWFIENNPNGQWAFVDVDTVEDIAKALARMLEMGVSPW